MSDFFVPWTEEMSFADRKRNCVGHMFDVGCGFFNEAPFWREHPERNLERNFVRKVDGMLGSYEPVIVLCKAKRGENTDDLFWLVLSSVGIVWTKTKYFASVM